MGETEAQVTSLPHPSNDMFPCAEFHYTYTDYIISYQVDGKVYEHKKRLDNDDPTFSFRSGIVMFVRHERRSLKCQDYTGEVYSVTVYRSRSLSPTHCTAYFTYIVDDYEYEGVVYRSTEIYDEGDSIGLLYNPDKPWQYTTVTTASDIKSGLLILAGGLLTYFEVMRLLKRWEAFNDIEDAKKQIVNQQINLDTE